VSRALRRCSAPQPDLWSGHSADVPGCLSAATIEDVDMRAFETAGQPRGCCRHVADGERRAGSALLSRSDADDYTSVLARGGRCRCWHVVRVPPGAGDGRVDAAFAAMAGPGNAGRVDGPVVGQAAGARALAVVVRPTCAACTPGSGGVPSSSAAAVSSSPAARSTRVSARSGREDHPRPLDDLSQELTDRGRGRRLLVGGGPRRSLRRHPGNP